MLWIFRGNKDWPLCYIEIMTSEQVSESNDKQCRRLACNRGCFATRIMVESSSHLNEDMVRLNVLGDATSSYFDDFLH